MSQSQIVDKLKEFFKCGSSTINHNYSPYFNNAFKKLSIDEKKNKQIIDKSNYYLINW